MLMGLAVCRPGCSWGCGHLCDHLLMSHFLSLLELHVYGEEAKRMCVVWLHVIIYVQVDHLTTVTSTYMYSVWGFSERIK